MDSSSQEHLHAQQQYLSAVQAQCQQQMQALHDLACQQLQVQQQQLALHERQMQALQLLTQASAAQNTVAVPIPSSVVVAAAAAAASFHAHGQTGPSAQGVAVREAATAAVGVAAGPV